jgi:hypothetical protein
MLNETCSSTESRFKTKIFTLRCSFVFCILSSKTARNSHESWDAKWNLWAFLAISLKRYSLLPFYSFVLKMLCIKVNCYVNGIMEWVESKRILCWNEILI